MHHDTHGVVQRRQNPHRHLQVHPTNQLHSSSCTASTQQANATCHRGTSTRPFANNTTGLVRPTALKKLSTARHHLHRVICTLQWQKCTVLTQPHQLLCSSTLQHLLCRGAAQQAHNNAWHKACMNGNTKPAGKAQLTVSKHPRKIQLSSRHNQTSAGWHHCYKLAVPSRNG